MIVCFLYSESLFILGWIAVLRFVDGMVLFFLMSIHCSQLFLWCKVMLIQFFPIVFVLKVGPFMLL